MNYKRINQYLGWLVFLIATIVYFMTIEDTVSLWDCGEYITAAYKLEVGHPPGAPLFMVIGRLFSFFADPENVAVWINRLSALSSSLTILFMFWSMTILIKKMILSNRKEISKGDKIAIFGSALVGSLAYTFSDSFWFSAVEGEVYAMSSLFTAIIFWAILKWDEEMMELQHVQLESLNYSPDRWLILIMFLLGLAIGVHLLGILVVPAISYLIYFRYAKQINIKGFLLIGILGVFILGFIQEAVIPGSIAMASSFEIAFVNSFGLPFFTGTIFFFLLVVGLCIYMLRYARKKGKRVLYSATMGLIVLLIGYGSFAVIVIRSNANPPLDENDPENLVTLHSYLKREQYGSAPLLFGPHWNSKENDPSEFKDQGPVLLRRFVVVKNDSDLKAFKDEKRANDYAKTVPGSFVDEKYFESNAGMRENSVPTYSQTTFFPRMYWSQEAKRIQGYKDWSGYDATDGSGGEMGKDGMRLPTFGENFRYFVNYQVDWMYWRYFMWNFSGRQNDIQGHGDALRGNWITGISNIDNDRLGNQDEYAPYYTSQNPSNNKFFLLPLILGLIGLLFHFYRAPKDAFVLLLAFLFTGVAIVVYLNQKPFEPRERDYAFAGSFYFFAMWIGVGVYALYEAFRSFGLKEFKRIGIVAGVGLLLCLIDSNVAAITWLVIALVGAGLIALMVLLKRVTSSESGGALVAILLSLAVPLLMAFEGWDDHDRSNKTTAHNLALNYLNSCAKNSILFTNGDNDTFPLWYMQEVEGKRTDVRVANLSLMQTDWYTDQMKMKAYDSDPLPIKFTEDQILMYAGNTDHVLFSDLFDLFYVNAKPEIIERIIALRVKANKSELEAATARFSVSAAKFLETVSSTDPRVSSRLAEIKAVITSSMGTDMEKDVYRKFQSVMELMTAARGGMLTISNEAYQGLMESVQNYEQEWNMTDLQDAMAFVRDDNNMVTFQGQRTLRVFPSSGFKLKVNKNNAVKSGIITEKEKESALNEIKFRFDKGGISREQVMMLDILANNEWKRAIYFSSPGGSDVSLSLLRGMTGRDGYIKQNGMAFELSPMPSDAGSVNRELMYENLMNTYEYGAMNDPKVLTDYYARRHTAQYRSHFSRLAEDYLLEVVRAEQERERIKMMKQMGADEATIPQPRYTDKDIAEAKKKAISLLNKSLEVMPADVVIDYGESNPNSDPRRDYEFNGTTLKSYTDGILHEYVQLYFQAGAKKEAVKLGLVVAEQLESIMDYFEHSDVKIAANPANTPDLYAAIESYFQMHVTTLDPEFGDPKGELAKRTGARIKHLYEVMYPNMISELKKRAQENGESLRRSTKAGPYAKMLFQLEDYSQAMAINYGLIDPPAAPPANAPSPSPALPSPAMPMPGMGEE
jgi:hypothetical protein